MKTAIVTQKNETVTREQFDRWIKDEYTNSNISKVLFEHTTDLYYPNDLDQDTQLPSIYGVLFSSESFILQNGKPSERVKKEYHKYDFYVIVHGPTK